MRQMSSHVARAHAKLTLCKADIKSPALTKSQRGALARCIVHADLQFSGADQYTSIDHHYTNSNALSSMFRRNYDYIA